MNQEEPITNYMATKLITFHPNDDIWDAISTIVDKKISGTPVVDEKGILVGMLSEVDCMRVILQGPYNNQPGGIGTVSNFMSSNVTTINQDMTLMEAALKFSHSKYKRFPVLENGKLVGQLSRSDVLKAISKMKPKVNKVPDSWKRRMPVLEPSKQGRHSGNS